MIRYNEPPPVPMPRTELSRWCSGRSCAGIWIEANVMVGQNYNVDSNIVTNKDWSKLTEYGVQVLPSLEIYLADGFSLELHFGILSLGWYGTTAHYIDRKEVGRTPLRFCQLRYRSCTPVLSD